MQASCTYGSMRGASSNGRSYRDSREVDPDSVNTLQFVTRSLSQRNLSTTLCIATFYIFGQANLSNT